MSYALYITHPEVILDVAVPATQWQLSPRGRERVAAFAHSAAMRPIRTIIASTETRTMQTAELLAVAGAELIAGRDMHENVRSATGVVPAERFEQLMDAFYERPEISSGGWETAAASAARIVAAVSSAAREHARRAPLAFVGHGTVGTLLKCHLGGRPATRDQDQRRMAHPGGGNVFAFSLPELRLLCHWLAMEEFAGLPG